VPVNERPFPDPASDEIVQRDQARSERNSRLSHMQGRKRSLQLAGAMALKNRPMSPLSMIKATRGFVTKKRVSDVHEQKAALAAKEYTRLGFKYENPHPPVFRDTENALAFKQKDFLLRTKVDAMENPHALSEFNQKPRFHEDIRRGREALATEREGLQGLQEWERNHPLNHRYVPMAVQPDQQPQSTQHLHGATVATFKEQNL